MSKYISYLKERNLKYKKLVLEAINIHNWHTLDNTKYFIYDKGNKWDYKIIETYNSKDINMPNKQVIYTGSLNNNTKTRIEKLVSISDKFINMDEIWYLESDIWEIIIYKDNKVSFHSNLTSCFENNLDILLDILAGIIPNKYK